VALPQTFATFFAAQRFLAAAETAFRPAVLSFRFDFFTGAAFALGADSLRPSPIGTAEPRACA
jgi:hypothetical protein